LKLVSCVDIDQQKYNRWYDPLYRKRRKWWLNRDFSFMLKNIHTHDLLNNYYPQARESPFSFGYHSRTSTKSNIK